MTLTLWTYRRFIWVNAVADLRHRFSGSIGGYLWNVLVPLAQIAVFAVIFSVLMSSQSPETPAARGKFTFVIYLCSGLLAWNAFAETLVRASGSLVGNAGYLKKLPLPEQIFVAKESATGFLQTLLSLTVFLLFAMTLARSGWHWQWLQAVPLLALFIGFAYGLGLVLACLNVFFRDIQPFMTVVTLLWMWLTPVVYQETIFANTDHQWMLTLMHFNPAYHFIKAFQASLYEAAWITPRRWVICLAIAVVMNLLAVPVLRLLRSEIRDVI
jgi:lipopolysaccharide transport system permease protein